MRFRGVLTISRYWDNPRINTAITDEQIALRVSLDGFIKALKIEMGSMAMVFSKKTFDYRMDQAVARVLFKIKEESTKVV